MTTPSDKLDEVTAVEKERWLANLITSIKASAWPKITETELDALHAFALAGLHDTPRPESGRIEVEEQWGRQQRIELLELALEQYAMRPGADGDIARIALKKAAPQAQGSAAPERRAETPTAGGKPAGAAPCVVDPNMVMLARTGANDPALLTWRESQLVCSEILRLAATPKGGDR